MKECPKCKGTQGYIYVLVVRYYQECDWEGNPISAECGPGIQDSEGRMLECVECGVRFRRSTIEKGES